MEITREEACCDVPTLALTFRHLLHTNLMPLVLRTYDTTLNAALAVILGVFLVSRFPPMPTQAKGASTGEIVNGALQIGGRHHRRRSLLIMQQLHCLPDTTCSPSYSYAATKHSKPLTRYTQNNRGGQFPPVGNVHSSSCPRWGMGGNLVNI